MLIDIRSFLIFPGFFVRQTILLFHKRVRQKSMFGELLELPMLSTDSIVVNYLGKWRGAVHIHINSCAAVCGFHLRVEMGMLICGMFRNILTCRFNLHLECADANMQKKPHM